MYLHVISTIFSEKSQQKYEAPFLIRLERKTVEGNPAPQATSNIHEAHEAFV